MPPRFPRRAKPSYRAAGVKSAPDGSPAVWLSMCRRVIVPNREGMANQGRCALNGASRSSRPDSTNCSTASAVMDLPMLPIWNLVSNRTGRRDARSAYPKPVVYRVRLASVMQTETPAAGTASIHRRR